MLQDLKDEDQVYHDSLQKLMSMDDIESMYLDFTVTEIIGGKPKIVELVPEGRSKCVASNNLARDAVRMDVLALLGQGILPQASPAEKEFLVAVWGI